MPTGSAAGLDGMRPIFLKQLTSQMLDEDGRRLLRAITKLANLIIKGCARDFQETIFGATLVASKKPERGVRPIAVGSVYRRLTGRFGARQGTFRLAEHLSPIQVGVGVGQGCEAGVHALRQYVMCNTINPECNKIIVKVGIRNAFNSVM